MIGSRSLTLYRRSEWLAAHWEGERLQVRHHASRGGHELTAAEQRLLTELGAWRTFEEISRFTVGTSASSLRRSLARLCRLRLVESSDDPPTRQERALSGWRAWAPLAAQFHFGSKDGDYGDPRVTDQILATRVRLEPPPPPLKALPGRRIKLPEYPRDQGFPALLLARRSWRHFAGGQLTLSELSTLVGLTWGVQKWVHAGRMRLALKTSPSAGASHSIEAYLAVQGVDGLAPGIYHYCPDAHALLPLGKSWTPSQLSRRLAGQRWFAKAGVVFFMTAIFGRVQWKYRTPRAYRTVLLDAGHLCQTFCLVATWLGLAPFCTAALADSLIERDLKIDGVGESVIYAAGVGRRSASAAWAPWWDKRPIPMTSAPAHHMVRQSASGSRVGRK